MHDTDAAFICHLKSSRPWQQKEKSSYLSWFHRRIVDSDEVSRNTVTPPQLPRDTPIPEKEDRETDVKINSVHTFW